MSSENKLSGKLYQLLLTLHSLPSSGSNKLKWINYVKSILDDTGFSNIWNSQQNININFLKTTVKQRLQSSSKNGSLIYTQRKTLSTPMFFWNDKWYDKYHKITDQKISRAQWWTVRTIHWLSETTNKSRKMLI